MSEISLALHVVELAAIAWLARTRIRKARFGERFEPGFLTEAISGNGHEFRRVLERWYIGKPTPETTFEA